MQDRIVLLRAIRAVAKMDSNPRRMAVFEDIARRSRLIRLVLFMYRVLGRTPLATLMVGVYGLKFFVFLRIPESHSKLVSATTYQNETKQIEYIKTCLRDSDLVVSVQFGPSISGCWAFLRSLQRVDKCLQYFRIVGKFRQKMAFMPVCRVASALCYYLRYREELEATKAAGVLVASNYCPQSIAVSSAARELEIPSIYIAHAPIPRSPDLLPLRNDLTILNSPSCKKHYAINAPIESKVVYKGGSGRMAPMSLAKLSSGEICRVGIFLTALTDDRTLSSWIDFLLDSYPSVEILIRPHPVKIVAPELGGIRGQDGRVAISEDRSLSTDVESCELILAGNSSVHLEVLRMGVPTVYLFDLDRVSQDFFGLVENCVIPAVVKPEDFSISSILELYSDPAWADRFRGYDPSYLREESELGSKVRAAVLELIGRA